MLPRGACFSGLSMAPRSVSSKSPLFVPDLTFAARIKLNENVVLRTLGRKLTHLDRRRRGQMQSASRQLVSL
jgi:hypothetical protein